MVLRRRTFYQPVLFIAMYKIEILEEALDDIGELRAYDQRLVFAQIEAQLAYQPNQETRNRKRLRPNQLAEWELKIDQFRVFYDIVSEFRQVRIVAVGYKQGNRLFIKGQEYQL